jgi:UDP-N-acetyl-2-amino-2-deoxyglucuronate dehydrogenase
MKFAVIGLGWIFKTEGFIFKLVKRAEIIAVCDINENLAKKYGNKLKVPFFTSTQQLYESDLVFDAVYIATPHHTHKPLMMEAISHKKHIFCEKPITDSVQDAEEVIKAAKEQDIKIGINYQYRYDPACYTMARAVQDQYLGKILYATVSVPWYRGEKYYVEGPWRKQWKSAGGGTLITHASHSLDVLIWALGKPRSVIGNYATRSDLSKKMGIEVEDVAMGIIEFESGAIAQVLSTSCTRPGSSTVKISIFGEQGNIKYTGPWPISIIKRLKWQRIRSKKYKLPTSGFINYSKILNGFIDWVSEGKEFYSTAESAFLTLKVVLAIYDSARLGQKVIL